MAYPTKYQHYSHEDLQTVDLTKKSLIYFLSREELTRPEELKKLIHVNTAKHVLFIYAQDMPILAPDILDTTGLIRHADMPYPNQMAQIDLFLQDHADTTMIASCGAGVSRSGFVHWYLDVINNHFDGICYARIKHDGIVYQNDIPNNEIGGYSANSSFVHYAMPYFNQKQKDLIANLPLWGDRD